MRRHITVPAHPHRCRQRPAIQFAIQGQGHRLNPGKTDRHHVVRQTGGHVLHQSFIRQHPVRNQVRRQRFVAFMLVVNHHRLFHLRVRGQRAFDFPQLNAVATDLDLKIIAPQIFQIAVRPPAYPITGFIQVGVTPRLIFRRGKRVNHKTLGGQFWPVPISAGQPRAPDVQFPRRTNGR